MSSPPRTTAFPWSSLLVTGLTLLLVWLFVRNLDRVALQRAFASANWGLVALGVVVTLQTYLLRTWRWQALLRPLGAVPFMPAFKATIIGFTAKALLFGHVGEVLRPFMLARQERLSVSATFATIILERVLDLTAVLLLFAVALPLLPMDVGSATRVAGLAAAAIAVVSLGAMFVFAGHPERVGQWVDRLSRWLPARVAAAIGGFARKFAEGLAVMREPRQLIGAMLWSIPLWLSIGAGIWLVSRAFELDVPFSGAFLIVMYLVAGVALPTPGGAGGFHVMYQLAATTHFGATADEAAAAAIMLHLVSFGPVALLGFVFMWQDGLTLGGLRHMQPVPTGPNPGLSSDPETRR
jgi:uncharacterized protein (TIRG00374 family)